MGENGVPTSDTSELPFDRDDVREDVAMRDDDAFRLGGRAGREDDLRGGVAIDTRLGRVPAVRRPAIRVRAASRIARPATRGAVTLLVRPARVLRRQSCSHVAENPATSESRSGTTTTPRSRQPQNAAIHSGRFSLQNTTASPRTRPRSSRRTAKCFARRVVSSYEATTGF